jgi:hypothetical protein
MGQDDKKKSKDIKAKSRAYTRYDDVGFVAPGIPRSVLAKYDEDSVWVGRLRVLRVTLSGKSVRVALEFVNGTFLLDNYASE